MVYDARERSRAALIGFQLGLILMTNLSDRKAYRGLGVEMLEERIALSGVSIPATPRPMALLDIPRARGTVPSGLDRMPPQARGRMVREGQRAARPAVPDDGAGWDLADLDRFASKGQIAGRYIVVFKDSVRDPGRASSKMARQHGMRLGHVYTDALKGFSATVPAGRLRALQNDPRVAYMEADQLITALVLPSGIDRIEADLSPTARINGVDERVNADIAILDTGIQADHPDLNVVGGVNFTAESSSSDGNGHGTHVAGVAAALDNGYGVVGAAPGARLWAVKVLDSGGSGSLSAIIKGVDWVTANAARIEVANMRLGFNGTSSTLDRAIARSVSRGVVYAVASGNSGADASGFSPARHPDVLAVSAINDTDGQPGGRGPSNGAGADDTFAYFSNFGSAVDIAAPGVDILSTYTGGGYARLSGTSMASPHVAGAAALYMATRPRDVNRDGVVDARDAAAVRTAIISAAFSQVGISGFGGDPDSFRESLLNVDRF